MPEQHPHPTNSPIPKHLAPILKALGIKDLNTVSLTKQPGIPTTMQTMQLVKPSPDIQNILTQLDLSQVEVVMTLAAQDEIDRIRKKLKEIKESTIDKQNLKKLLALLNIPEGTALIIVDKDGGIQLVHAGLEEIQNRKS